METCRYEHRLLDEQSGVSRAGVFGEGKLAVAWLEKPKAFVELKSNSETKIDEAVPTKPKRVRFFGAHWRQMRALKKKLRRLKAQLRKLPKQKLRELRRKSRGLDIKPNKKSGKKTDKKIDKKPEKEREKTLEEKREEMFLESLEE